MFLKTLRNTLKTRKNFFSKNFCSKPNKNVPKQKVVLLPGHGIGPEISASVVEIFYALNVPIEWEFHEVYKESVTKDGDLITKETLDSIRRNKYALKGPFETPIGEGYRSLNVTLRKKLNLFANVRPCSSFPGIKTNYDDVNVVTIRENTEGEYSGLEHQVTEDVVENLKIISEKASRNIAEYAFNYAESNGRKEVVACHKAGIMKLGDGLFLRECEEIAKKYPKIKFRSEQVDTICYKLARNPKEIDVMVMPNLYGDIVSDLCAGLVGGLGLTPSGNIGFDCSVFEAVHGTGPDIAGQNKANPTALLLSSSMMLKHMNLDEYSEKLSKAILATLKDGKVLTGDLGGNSSTTEFTKSVIDRIKSFS